MEVKLLCCDIMLMILAVAGECCEILSKKRVSADHLIYFVLIMKRNLRFSVIIYYV